MGLDQYLYAEKFVSGYSFDAEDEQTKYQAIVGLVDAAAMVDESTPSATVRVCVAYWRKMNAIHNWFVVNVQDRVDDCQPCYVPVEKLQELRDLCAHALGKYDSGQREELRDLLPPVSGFFFGSTDVDDWYRQGLEDTVTQLDKVLNTPHVEQKYSFYYQSSW